MTSTHWLESSVVTGADSVEVASLDEAEVELEAEVDLAGLLGPDEWTTVVLLDVQPAVSVAVTTTAAIHHRFAIISSWTCGNHSRRGCTAVE
ncbi:MAG: hypothetical protein K2Z76_22140 [Mycobacterium gordonae]|nr:hypothetical protein [Mycobacterium gordonae]